MNYKSMLTGTALLAVMPTLASTVATFPMNVSGNRIDGGPAPLEITGNFKPMQIKGLEGNAWRTDGNSSRATGNIPQLVNGNEMTATLRFAVDTYTIVEHETGTERFVEVVSCLNDFSRTGFAFLMNRTGQYQAKVYVGNQLVTVTGHDRIPMWEWTELTVTVNGTDVRLYRNGNQISQNTASNPGVKVGDTTLYVARANQSGTFNGTETCAFNGAFDELTISDSAEVKPFTPQYADLNLPADRYAGDRMRARFHGQPGMNWTNETHGLFHNIGGDGKWHAFFQRTGSTPMMSHQHWGHIVSDDLVTWRDDAPALAPSEYYDIKGCWSGCVFSDPQFNNGVPTIIYTGVDFARPYAAMAFCDDKQNMRRWHKDGANPIDVNANCGDARDTYFYRTDDNNAYFMIGARDAVHYYRWNNSRWEYKGEFYHTQDGVDNGHNTEMPNVTRIGDKWMMTTSPLAGKYGTACLYRTGDLNDGRFVNYSAAERVDFFGYDGYGLLSPSPSTLPDGRTVALGIVPDKLPGDLNIKHGYAHLYSLPRVWSLDGEGRLMQKPYEGIYAYRNKSMKLVDRNIMLDGTLNLTPVRGREAEVSATFRLSDAKVGINFFKNEKGNTAYISYDPKSREIKINYSKIAHYNTGRDEFSSILPLGPVSGEILKLNVFIDHSIVDIFVNDRYAASVRVFPEDDNADVIELFTEGATKIIKVEAYVLGDGDMSEEKIVPPAAETLETTGKVALYVGYPDAASLMADNSAKEEQATYNYFINTFKSGKVLFSGDCDRIDVTDFDMVWVNCDRRGLEKGWQNLPAQYSKSELVDALRDYRAAGGNIYLSKMASQLAVAIGRLADPGDRLAWGNGAGGFKDDEWQMNVCHYGNDWTEHPMMSGLDFQNLSGNRKNLTLMSGAHNREDHNCMWDLNAFGGHNAFCADNNATVIGTWGHEGGESHAGLFILHPKSGNSVSRATSQDVIDARKGTVVINGMAAYEWAPTGGTNNSYDNIVKLTNNIIKYLSPKTEEISGGEIVPTVPETLETTGKVALYVGYPDAEALMADNSAKEEQATYNYFISNYNNGKVLFSGDCERIDVTDFDMVWVNCDRQGVEKGWQNLPAQYSKTELVDALRDYRAAGGNIYLSKMASQLAVAVGRIADPGDRIAWGNGAGSFKDDEWQMNVCHYGNDWTEHPMMAGLDFQELSGNRKNLTLMSGGHNREDHNCMWDLNAFGGHDLFCDDNNATVIGTWGHEGGESYAGLIIFHPQSGNPPTRSTAMNVIDARKGTIVVNGLAAYEWAPTNGTNNSFGNIVKLTDNIIKYLSPKVDEGTLTGVESVTDEPCAEPVYFNLQGLRVERPTKGIYIEVRGNRSRKVMF